MKIKLENNEVIDISVIELADNIYSEGQYLLDNFEEKDLMESGSDFCGTDCRLQWHEGYWQLHVGSADYDQDHRGYWACGSIPRGCSKKEAHDIASQLINEIE